MRCCVVVLILIGSPAPNQQPCKLASKTRQPSTVPALHGPPHSCHTHAFKNVPAWRHQMHTQQQWSSPGQEVRKHETAPTLMDAKQYHQSRNRGPLRSISSAANQSRAVHKTTDQHQHEPVHTGTTAAEQTT